MSHPISKAITCFFLGQTYGFVLTSGPFLTHIAGFVLPADTFLGHTSELHSVLSNIEGLFLGQTSQ